MPRLGKSKKFKICGLFNILIILHNNKIRKTIVFFYWKLGRESHGLNISEAFWDALLSISGITINLRLSKSNAWFQYMWHIVFQNPILLLCHRKGPSTESRHQKWIWMKSFDYIEIFKKSGLCCLWSSPLKPFKTTCLAKAGPTAILCAPNQAHGVNVWYTHVPKMRLRLLTSTPNRRYSGCPDRVWECPVRCSGETTTKKVLLWRIFHRKRNIFQ